MSRDKITISGTGCALADFLYTGIDFSKSGFRKYLSKKSGDGGLSPGKLVFTEELEDFAGIPYSEILKDISGDKEPDAFNVGGPGLVSFIHTSQMLYSEDYKVRFYGSLGNDETAEKILGLVKKTPLDVSAYIKRSNKPTPFTHVLSDPSFAGGHGERTFINNIGAAWDFLPDILDDVFFSSDIVCFGGTALVPHIHDNLESLLRKAKKSNAFTLVNTVFDFRNEKNNPDKSWPLVRDYQLVDVLIMDREEALRISGETDDEKAARFFIGNNVSSFFITNGAGNIAAYSNGGLFNKMQLSYFPVSDLVTPGFRAFGDTTGCGDNFTGGIITSLALQLQSYRKNFDLISALSWAVASGGFTCSYIGGTFFENFIGEKTQKIGEIRNRYLEQIGY